MDAPTQSPQDRQRIEQLERKQLLLTTKIDRLTLARQQVQLQLARLKELAQ